jgi:hypothetical protein
MPHLSRRAVENKSVLGAGGAVRERTEAAALIWKKMNVRAIWACQIFIGETRILMQRRAPDAGL